ncbi:protogenin B-like isoform X1 [Hippoglossus hippoglossus]|uniref:protogenin B-like isoform X1 n=1 Tax=Hippoglossus hippoglossus TaxID=8267 RepID=UPI00148BD478|nr:protogenin B-like isoform X1 [Hippoglossus hippoglossus]
MTKFKMRVFQRWLLFVLFIPLSSVVCFSELSFITEPSDVTALPKDPAVLDCQAHGQPPVTIRWLKNGVRLAESEHIQFLPNGSLYIPKIKHTKEDSDEGFYQCLSQNKYGAILSQRSRLTIASISKFLLHPVPVVVTEGSVARFSCAVPSSPPATITWELNQSTLPLQTDRITVLPNGVLQIHNVRLEDAGQYRCVATNIGSRLKSREATLTVNQGAGPKPRQRPQIIAGPQNVTIPLHKTVVLECVATGNPWPIISWSRADSKPIDVYNAKVLGNGNLVITDASSKHSGVYLCRATTPGTRNYTIAAANITVLEPPSIVESPESQTRPRAGTARFMCQAEGVPPPRISWLKNGEQVHLNGRIKMYNSKLVITQIIPEDDAIYQCLAESEQGSVLSLARLIVVMSEDRPSAPRNIHAETISSSAILLAWERPLYNADKVIAYSIHYMKAEGLNNEEYQVVIGNDTTSYIIDDLEPARNYSFYIVAYMPMGASRMSDQVSQHTLEDVPLRTPELTLTSHSSTDIQVSWQLLPAKLSRGQVSAYRLSYRTASDTTVTSVELPQNSTEHLLESLQPDTIYLLRMAAATRVGWCEPSAWTSHRTPKASSNKVPSAPVLQLEPLNCTCIVARWQTSTESVAVQGYRLCYHEEGQPEQPHIQLQAQTNTYTISGLDPRRKYHVKILAVSQAGDGYQTDQTVSTPGCVSAREQPTASPPPPDHVIVLAKNSSAVSLRWSRPAFTSGKAVSYTVRCTPVGTHNASAIRYIQITKQSVMVQNLVANTRYEFVVRLHVDQMSSPWSSLVYHRTLPAAPSQPPGGLRVTLIEEDTALVSWREPTEPNMVVTQYTILYASQQAWMAGHWQILQREGTHTMALLEKLEPGNVYLVKISASNQIGEGPFSNIVELVLKRGINQRSKNPRNSDNFPDTEESSDGHYNLDQRSMTGIIVGVSIALACIVMCALILLSKGRPRKSSSHKVIAVGAGEDPRAGMSLPSERHTDNVEAHIPMISGHFLDPRDGSSMVINGAGPASNKNQSNRWLIFQREIRNQAESDAESRASLYEAGKTVLRYDGDLISGPLSPSSREIIYGPFHTESSHTSEGSQETGDSGHYSNEESNEEMSNPSTSQSSRPESFGPNDEDAVTELTQSFQVENEKKLSPLHHSAPDASRLCCILEGSHVALHASQAAES